MKKDDLSNGKLLSGRIALVTGAVGMIGKAIAHRMAQFGADVVIGDLDEKQVQEVASEVNDRHGVRSIGVEVDVTRPETLEAAADSIESQLGVVDVIIPNAGVLLTKSAVDIATNEWDAVINVNLSGAFHTATVFARRLKAAGQRGSITFSSSLFGVRGGRGNAAYSASKFGIIGLAQSMAAELAPDGIRANSVCPGQIDTSMLQDLFTRRSDQNATSPDLERARFLERIPAGRLGTSLDVANTFVYLASDLSEYVTGQSILVDGGWQVG